MISLSQSLCECEPLILKETQFFSLSKIENCTPCELKNNRFTPVSINQSLCPCPEKPKIVYRLVEEIEYPRKTISCFSNLIINITKTKFCDKGPKCN